MKNQCRIISNEQLDVFYEVEKWLLDEVTNSKEHEEITEKLSQTIRELDPSSDYNLKLEVNKDE